MKRIFSLSYSSSSRCPFIPWCCGCFWRCACSTLYIHSFLLLVGFYFRSLFDLNILLFVLVKKKEFKKNFFITICCHFILKFFHWFLELSSLIHARPIHENLDLNMQSALLIANAGLLRLRQRGARLIAFHLINLAYHFCLLGYFLWIRQTPSMR